MRTYLSAVINLGGSGGVSGPGSSSIPGVPRNTTCTIGGNTAVCCWSQTAEEGHTYDYCMNCVKKPKGWSCGSAYLVNVYNPRPVSPPTSPPTGRVVHNHKQLHVLMVQHQILMAIVLLVRQISPHH